MKDLKLKNIRIITKSKPDYSSLFSTIWKKGSPLKNEFGKALHLFFTFLGFVAGFIQFYFLLPELTILQIPFVFVLAPIQMAFFFYLFFLIATCVLFFLHHVLFIIFSFINQHLLPTTFDQDSIEFSHDLTLLKEIAHENLSRDTFDSLHISDFSRNILDMYDHFLLVLVWTWIEHLRITKRNTELFITLLQQRFPSVASLYDDLLSDMELHFQAKAIEDGLYLYTPSPQEDYCLHIAYAINWSSKHLFRDDSAYMSFARVLTDSIKPFLHANKL